MLRPPPAKLPAGKLPLPRVWRDGPRPPPVMSGTVRTLESVLRPVYQGPPLSPRMASPRWEEAVPALTPRPPPVEPPRGARRPHQVRAASEGAGSPAEQSQPRRSPRDILRPAGSSTPRQASQTANLSGPFTARGPSASLVPLAPHDRFRTRSQSATAAGAERQNESAEERSGPPEPPSEPSAISADPETTAASALLEEMDREREMWEAMTADFLRARSSTCPLGATPGEPDLQQLPSACDRDAGLKPSLLQSPAAATNEGELPKDSSKDLEGVVLNLEEIATDTPDAETCEPPGSSTCTENEEGRIEAALRSAGLTPGLEAALELARRATACEAGSREGRWSEASRAWAAGRIRRKKERSLRSGSGTPCQELSFRSGSGSLCQEA